MKSSYQNKSIPLLLSLSFLFVLCFTNVNAGDDKNILIGKKITIHSKILDENRILLIYLPIGYENSKQKYPVIYVLDGRTHFIHASGIVEFLSGQGSMPQSILVAIANVDRNRDFTPTNTNPNLTYGGGYKFLSFLSDELKPYMNENYRTQDYSTIIGHSLGGLFATFAFLQNPDVFDSYIAISPYLMFDHNLIVISTSENIQEKYRNEKFFYMTLGNEPDYTKSIDTFVKIVKKASPPGFNFQYEHMISEDHGSIPHLSIYKGLEANYPNWRITQDQLNHGIDAIDKHYRLLSKKYGYKIVVPEYVLNTLGYNYMNKREYNKAIEIFSENVVRYPESPNVYDSLGEALENNNRLEEAKENYTKAVSIAETGDFMYFETYKNNLKRVSTLLEKNK